MIMAMMVANEGRLYDCLVDAYFFNRESTVWFYSKTKRRRLKKHSGKLFSHAHWLIAKDLETHGIDWCNWRVRPYTTVHHRMKFRIEEEKENHDSKNL